MKLTVCLAIFALAASAQSLVTVPNIKVPPGRGTGTGTITYQSGRDTISALQIDLQYDTQSFLLTPTLSSAATVAGKMMSTNTLEGGSLRIVIVGFNQTPIPDGDLVALSVSAAKHVARELKTKDSGIYATGAFATTPDGSTAHLSANNGAIMLKEQ